MDGVLNEASTSFVAPLSPGFHTLAACRSKGPQQIALIKPALAALAANVLAALPAHAEAGKIFDFNFTLPIIVTEFLLLMVFLDKFWFGPVGRNLDERDKYLRDKLANVKVGPSFLPRQLLLALSRATAAPCC